MAVQGQLGGRSHDHRAHFFETDDDLVDAVGRHLVEGLHLGDAVAVVATGAHLEGLEAAISAAGIDVDEARADGRLITADAAATLQRFCRDGVVDSRAFTDVVGDLVRRAGETTRPVRAYGEMVGLLWDEGRVTAAIELEALWDDLADSLPFNLVCSYPAPSNDGVNDISAFNEVCRAHTGVSGLGVVGALRAGQADVEDARAFAVTPDAARGARRFVADTLANRVDDQLADDVRLIVSELATNAAIHAQSQFIVTVMHRGDAILVAVRDFNNAEPVLGALPSAEISGRGLGLVDALATRWGMQSVGQGKVVWAELDGS